ncbi:MAG TPA: metallophosphoesterase [Gammaproteobacteria bacterium]|nr:metallophosphoesterase [Gammaproteobacteria bacterium]
MRIQFFSDIHLEFGPLEFRQADAEVIVAAGDISLGLDGLRWLQTATVPVIYVAGNHEYYCANMPEVLEKLRAEGRGNPVYFLENDQVVINDVRFLGTTLWTDFNGGDQKLIDESRLKMNDYWQISNGRERLRPKDTWDAHHKARQWLRERLAEPFPGKTVVVTHHAPSLRSWYGGRSSPFLHIYCSDMDSELNNSGVALWIHGHIHRTNDYAIGRTRVVSNTRGYAGVQDIDGFDLGKVVEI